MGWTSTRSLEGHSGPQAYLDALYTWTNAGTTCRVLRSSLVGRSVYYAAIERTVGAGPPTVTAAVCLVRHRPRARDGWVFSYKDMDESMGPCETSCPASILDLLSPPPNEWATTWRAECRAYAEKTRVARATKLRPGQTIVFDEPIASTTSAGSRPSRSSPGPTPAVDAARSCSATPPMPRAPITESPG